ncbi:LacI family DNA-binding transcriptional regulator [Novosphingobium rosa]|uniref:LacI family DNA-binding transcriptional regulator n=1 Tax=Novosphingobium rosa TaxID=76978 RepID=UPI00083683A7|nr:LacI family DNA-binding transcriptional regulator [Novosphingobium rosa]
MDHKDSRAPTIIDVARQAGVSPMTVSRVINGKQAVRPATREAVQAAIDALGYAPSAAARALAGGEEIRICLLFSNPSTSFLSELLMGSLEQASHHNVMLAVEKLAEPLSVEAVLAHLKHARINGIILPPPLCDSPEMLAALRDAGIRAVTLAASHRPDHFSSINMDDRLAAREMTRHLVALGHRRIGFVKGNPAYNSGQRRFEGYVAALADAGLPLDETLIAQGLFNYRSGLDAAEHLLDLPEPPTAIFACNDDMAAAAVAIAHGRGLDVPGDLTVCGFDDTPLATTIWPELTTVHQPISDMARAAVDLLVRDLRGQRDDAADEPSHVLLDFKLVRRQSDAAPRRRPRGRPKA